MTKSDIDYLSINRNSWNNRTEVHIASDFYKMQEFLDGASSINPIELSMLGDIRGKTILHLQCHFGQDSISLARMGSKVTGIDLSDVSILKATEFANKTASDAEFICCDVYDVPKHDLGQFDIVFTTYGTIGWLPDIDKWAHVISSSLKPGGRLVFVEFHPVLWMFDNDFETIQYKYFKDEPIIEYETGTYADRNSEISQEYISWNHSISEVCNALLKNGLQITSLNEFDYSPYNIFKVMTESEPGKFRIEKLGDKIPMIYSVEAKKI